MNFVRPYMEPGYEPVALRDCDTSLEKTPNPTSLLINLFSLSSKLIEMEEITSKRNFENVV